MSSDINEKSLETIIFNHMVNINKYEASISHDLDLDYLIDKNRLFSFLKRTQENNYNRANLELENKRIQFLSRLYGEIEKYGITHLLRKGFDFVPCHFELFYLSPSENNLNAVNLYNNNIFSISRQQHFSKINPNDALDLCVFINGLPIITFELKNHYTGQNVKNAVEQYKNDRPSREPLFHFGRCIVHFAVDDDNVMMCTELKDKSSWFLPFDKGNNGGAGNPVNPNGFRTSYLWEEILRKNSLTNIIENYTQIVIEKDQKTGKKKSKQIFPRYHQLNCVEKILDDVKNNGCGKKYLIQHSAGSGKSNSISWLALQLVSVMKNGENVFDSVIIVTDRKVLDKQIKNNTKNFAQLPNLIGHAGDNSNDSTLKSLIESGKKIIITTIHRFKYIAPELSGNKYGKKFAILIDEAHSSQSGEMRAKMNLVLSDEFDFSNCEDVEDIINIIIDSRKMLDNASYFAFTATPKNKTLEMFGTPYVEGDKTRYKPFHVYTMKQAIQEGFILDVLKNYTPISSYYKIIKKVEDDPIFDKKKAQKKLRNYVESQLFPIEKKSEIIVDHFLKQVIAKGKINGQARAMVVCSSILRAIDYYTAISKELEKRNSPFKCIIAFSGDKEYGNDMVDEAKINGFPSSEIELNFEKDPYRILVVADKFQTGFDQPLLHTMYVDKVLTDIKAVQTLSRLNRACPGKYDTFVLDFANSIDDIKKAFSTYYKETVLADSTDPNKLFDIQHEIEHYCYFTNDQVDRVVELFLSNADRRLFDPIIDVVVEEYKKGEEDEKIGFKSACKSFVRIYSFLSCIIDCGVVFWEKLSIFLNLLIPKLPSPEEDDLSKGILETIDLDSYRVEVNTTRSIILDEESGELSGIPLSTKSVIAEAQLDTLSNILATFHGIWGNIDWKNEDHITKQIALIPEMVSSDEAYQNAMKNSDRENARIESDKALKKVMESIMFDNIELFKQFSDNPEFARWLSDLIFNVTYKSPNSSLSSH